jgi:hypothetical protein
VPFPPCSLMDEFMHPTSPTLVCVDLHANQNVDSTLAQLHYQLPTITASVTHAVCSPRVCGICSNNQTSVKIRQVAANSGNLIDGGSNICVTGDPTILLDLTNIAPIDISVALDGTPSLLDDKITKHGLLPLTLSDGTIYYQTRFYCVHMVETIISPAAILASSNVFYYWTQDGCKDPTVPGRIRFTSKDGLLSMFFYLEYRDGLYYCSTDVFAVDHDNSVRVCCRQTNAPLSADVKCIPSKFAPATSRARQVESEVWLLCLGSPGEGQLDILPGNVTGTPAVFEYHPF